MKKTSQRDKVARKKNKPDPYKNLDEKRLKEAAKDLVPVLRLGKKGITDNVIKEIGEQLEKRYMIKIKFLQSFMDNYNRRTIGENISQRTDSRVILQVGGVLVLYRR